MRWQDRFWYLLLGLVFALGHAPYGYLAIGAPFAIVLMGYHLLHLKTARQGLRVGWWFGIGYFGWTMQWIVSPFFVDPAVIWLAPFALLFLALGLALFWAVPMAIAVGLFATPWTRLLGWAVLFSLAEYARANILTGFPWGQPFYLTINTPLAQLAALIGPHGGFLILLGVLLLPLCSPTHLIRGGVLAVIAFGLLWGWGWLRHNTSQPPRENPIVVRLIQPNAPQHLKWHPDHKQVFWQRQLDFTSAPSTPQPDVIIWPETSVYGGGNTSDIIFAQIANAAGSDTAVIAGYNSGNATEFKNALAYIGDDGALIARYDKHHLVPFGEYFPFPKLANRFGLRGLAELASGYSKGTGPTTIRDDAIPDFVPLICYEAIFPQYARGDGARAQWLVHITNDAWFGTFAGPQQHLVQAQFRAIEQGLPLARAANTGISAMIDPYGNITQAIGLGQAGFIDATLPKALPLTPYARYGDLPWLCASFILLLLMLIKRLR